MNHKFPGRGKRGFAAILVLSVATMAMAARADEIVLMNGDRISGTIDSADAGKIIITSPFAGIITVDMKNVKTFSTDHPIKIQLDDGTVINQQILEGPPGAISTGLGTLASQQVAMSKIQKINPPPVAWNGAIVINGLLAQGDTNSEQLGASVDAVRETDLDRIHFGAAYLFGKQKINGIESTTEDNWFINGQYDYRFTKQFYGYGNVRVEKDRILQLDLRLTPGVGAGYEWFDSPDFHFDTEGGLSWVYEQYTNVATPNENISVRLAYHVNKTFFDSKLTLFHDLQYFPSIQNSSDYLILANAGMRVAITKTMFSELKAEVDYDSRPAPMSHRTDAKYILGVGWTF